MVGAVFQPCWSAWGIPALETTGCWVVPSVGKKMATFKRPMRTPQNCCHQCLCLCSEPQPSPASVRDPPLLSGHLAQSLWSHCFFPWVLVCETLCVPSESGVCFPRPAELLCSNLLQNYCAQTPLVFKVVFSEGSFSCHQTSRLGSLIRGSELSFLWEILGGIIIFQFVGHPPGMYEIWFYHGLPPPSISLWLLFVFGCRVSQVDGGFTLWSMAGFREGQLT